MEILSTTPPPASPLPSSHGRGKGKGREPREGIGLARIYTRSGDDGTTALASGARTGKADPRVEAYGTVDELNACLGMLRTLAPADMQEILQEIQADLFVLGANLSFPHDSGPEHPAQPPPVLDPGRVAALEHWIDAFSAGLPPLRHFVLPGGTPLAAWFHLARTVCRRAERRVVGLSLEPGVRLDSTVVPYLNRLSDFLFVLARVANQRGGGQEIFWKPRKPKEQPEG